mgnify:CR=1 FL=1
MNKFMRTAIQAVFGIFLATTAQAGDRCVIPDGANEMVQRMAVVVNETRGQLHRGQMRYNATLSQSAQGHACDMAVNGFFDHHGRNGSTPGQRAKQAGYRYCQIAENLTYGEISPKTIWHAGWAAMERGSKRSFTMRSIEGDNLTLAMSLFSKRRPLALAS